LTSEDIKSLITDPDYSMLFFKGGENMTPDPHPILVIISTLGLVFLPSIFFLLWAASQRPVKKD